MAALTRLCVCLTVFWSGCTFVSGSDTRADAAAGDAEVPQDASLNGTPDAMPDATPGACSMFFEDVPTTHYAYEDIRALWVNGIVKGCSDSPLLFCPGDPILRHSMGRMLIDALDDGLSQAPCDAYFDDICGAGLAGDVLYINRLFELGITNGCADGSFCPNDATRRDEMAVFVVRALGESESTATCDAYFDDICDVPFAAGSINKLKEMGVVQGCDANSYCPTDDLRRAQAASMLANAFGYTSDVCNP